MRTMSPRCNAGLQHTQVPPFSAPTSRIAKSTRESRRCRRRSNCEVLASLAVQTQRGSEQSNATIDDAFVALVSLVLHRRGLNQETT